MSYTAKTVTLDAATNHGDAYMAFRQMDFWYEGAKLVLTEADYTAYATTTYSGADVEPEYAFDTNTLKTGGNNAAGWMSNNVATNQRLNVVFNSEITFDSIFINNYHTSGAETDRGIQDAKITISTDAITSTVYDSDISNSTRIFNGVFDKHVDSDVEDSFQIVLRDFTEPVLLIHSNTTDGSTIFTDSSDSGHSITPVGDAQNSTVEQVFGTTSMYFDGTLDHIYVVESPDFALSDNDFTFDFWIKRARTGTREFVCGQLDSGGGTANANLAIELQSDDTIRIQQGIISSTYFLLTPGLSMADTDWHHLALVLRGGTLTVYLDGTAGVTTQDMTGLVCTDQSTNFTIGRAGDYDGLYFQGYIDEVRLLNGYAYWVTNFIPPTGPYPIILSGKVIVIVEEYWDLVMATVQVAFTELYNITASLFVVVTEPYGAKLGTQMVEYYGDASTLTKSLNEYYGDTNLPSRSMDLRYGDALGLRNSCSEFWDIKHIPIKIVEETYSVSAFYVAAAMVMEYSLEGHDKVLKALEMPYYMPSVDGVTATVNISVHVDGIPVDFIAIDVDAGMDRYSLFSHIELASLTDYLKCPLLGEVVCVIDAETFKFFIENRRQAKTNQGTSWGIDLVSPTVKLDAPYSKTMVSNFEDGIYASVLVSELAALGNVTVDWGDTLDWSIPKHTLSANDETPLQVIKKIVNAIGAIIQTKPNGDMLIISRYPVSPTAWETTVPVVSFHTDTDIVSLGEAIIINSGFNAYIITDQGTSVASITLQEVYVNATTKIIRGFRVPFKTTEGVDDPFDLETSGVVVVVKTQAPIEATVPYDFDTSTVEADKEVWEYVEFIEWTGTTRYPIYGVLETEWVSSDLGAIQISEDGTLTVVTKSDTMRESLLKIKYTTKYWEWTVTGQVDAHAQLYVPEITTS